MFKQQWLSVGGNFHQAADPLTAREILINLGRQCHPRPAAVEDRPLIRQLRVNETLAELGIEVLSPSGAWGSHPEILPGAEERRGLAEAGLGITVADYALADSGTLVILAGPGTRRSFSLLPPVHLALVPAANILPDLDALFKLLGQDQGPVNQMGQVMTFITGPSKTGDIEFNLVMGVHGPGRTEVIATTWT
ncbi:MAG: lactate utilization protein [Deltaproteobacteria bacterium]|nr:lactate utilization protein [Deltaproteobacteria bacterium]